MGRSLSSWVALLRHYPGFAVVLLRLYLGFNITIKCSWFGLFSKVFRLPRVPPLLSSSRVPPLPLRVPSSPRHLGFCCRHLGICRQVSVQWSSVSFHIIFYMEIDSWYGENRLFCSRVDDERLNLEDMCWREVMPLKFAHLSWFENHLVELLQLLEHEYFFTHERIEFDTCRLRKFRR